MVSGFDTAKQKKPKQKSLDEINQVFAHIWKQENIAFGRKETFTDLDKINDEFQEHLKNCIDECEFFTPAKSFYKDPDNEKSSRVGIQTKTYRPTQPTRQGKFTRTMDLPVALVLLQSDDRDAFLQKVGSNEYLSSFAASGYGPSYRNSLQLRFKYRDDDTEGTLIWLKVPKSICLRCCVPF